MRERVVPTVHRPEEMLRERLPVGPAELFAERLSAFAHAGVQRVFVWPVADEAAPARAVLGDGTACRRRIATAPCDVPAERSRGGWWIGREIQDPMPERRRFPRPVYRGSPVCWVHLQWHQRLGRRAPGDLQGWNGVAARQLAVPDWDLPGFAGRPSAPELRHCELRRLSSG